MSSLTDVARKRLLNILFGASLAMSFSLFIAACVAANKCYISPCMNDSDKGTMTTFKVNQGYSFQVVWTSMVFLALSVWGLRVFNKTEGPTSQQMGLFIGSVIISCMLALETAILWGSQTLMVDDLIGSYSQTHSAVKSKVNESTRPTFAAVCALCSILFVIYLALGALLYWVRFDDFTPAASPYGQIGADGQAISTDGNQAGASYQAYQGDTQPLGETHL